MLVSFHRHFGRTGMEGPNKACTRAIKRPKRCWTSWSCKCPAKESSSTPACIPRSTRWNFGMAPPCSWDLNPARVTRTSWTLRLLRGCRRYMVIHDPLFFEKIGWFEQQFGLKRSSNPCAMKWRQSGTPALVSVWPRISSEIMHRLNMRRSGQSERLDADWNGQRQGFALPTNPHVGGIFPKRCTASDTGLPRHGSMTGMYPSLALWKARCASPFVGRSTSINQQHPKPVLLSIEHWGTTLRPQLRATGCNLWRYNLS